MAKSPQPQHSPSEPPGLTPSAPPANVRTLPDYNPPPQTAPPVFTDNRTMAERINLPDADVAAAIAHLQRPAPETPGGEPEPHPPAMATHHCGGCGRVHAPGQCPREPTATFRRLSQCGDCGRIHWSDSRCSV
jgi:hypothetical protein